MVEEANGALAFVGVRVRMCGASKRLHIDA
jgi:hypothetical protein